jgi:predicted dehydrogenase
MVRLAVLGCGDVAFRTYFPGLLALGGDTEIVALCDPVAGRAIRAASLFPGSDALSTLDALVQRSDIDGVINLTPAPTHRATTAALLDADFHVLSEKPLATTVEEGKALIAHAQSVGKILLCAPAVMATPRVRWIQDLLASGAIGQATHAFARLGTMGPAGWAEYTGDPAVFYSPGVGPAIDLGVYLITTLTGLFGPAMRVQAVGGILIPERTITIPRLAGQKITVRTPDLISANLTFPGNRFATVISSFAIPSHRGPVLEVIGENGLAAVVDQMDYWVGQGVDLFQFTQSAFGPDGWSRQGPTEDEPLLFAGPRHFVACIKGEAEPVMPAEHALHVLEIMNAAEQAIQTGESIDLTTTFTLPSGTAT